MATATSTTAWQHLPKEIIQHIQSLLPLKDAAQTRLSSKPWLHAWYTIPNLRFHQPSSIFLNQEFRNFVDQTLKRYHQNNLPIESFSVFTLEDSASILYSWVHILANNNYGLKELTLSTYSLPTHMSWPLLSEISLIKTLKKLKIHVCSLREEQLVISCHHILNCQSLESLELGNVSLCEFFLQESLYSEEDYWSRNLKYLKLSMVTISDVLLDKLVTKLPFLEKLEIKNCGSLQRINIDSHSLKNLRLICRTALLGVSIYAPKLVVFYHEGLTWTTTLSFSNVRPTQLRTTVRPSLFTNIDISNFLWLMGSLTRFQPLREVSISKMNVVEIMSLKVSSLNLKDSRYVDAVLSVCHPKFVRILWYEVDSRTSFTEFSKTLEKQTEIQCCTSHGQIKCWRHYLKDVEYGYTAESEDDVSWELSIQWRSVMDRTSNCFKLTWLESSA